jgi:hypothetical protein
MLRRGFRPLPTSSAPADVFLGFLVRWCPFTPSSLSCFPTFGVAKILTELWPFSVRDTPREFAVLAVAMGLAAPC